MTRRTDRDLGSGGAITDHSHSHTDTKLDDIAKILSRPVKARELHDTEKLQQAGSARLRKRFNLPEKVKLTTFAERITGEKRTGEPTFLERLRQLRKTKK